MKKMCFLLRFLAVAAIAICTCSAAYAQMPPGDEVVVKDLRVEYLKNPIGIDAPNPRFSWKMEAAGRNVGQTAYEITLSADADGGNPVWTSGKVASDKSVHIPYDGAELLPATRYYWKVDVWDNREQQVTSTESAFFETGLLSSGWSNAKWLRATTKPIGEVDDVGEKTLTGFSIEMKFGITSAAAGPIFSAKDASNFLMWQINIGDNSKTTFRPHKWVNGGASLIEEVNITDIVGIIDPNEEHTLRIDVSGDIATTYIDDQQIDVRSNPLGEDYVLGQLGFRMGNTESSYYDDIKVTAFYEDETSATLLENDFSTTINPFTNSQVAEGKLQVGQNVIAWQKTEADLITKYSVEMDFEIVDVAAGPIFGARDASNFFMWQINIGESYASGGKTVLRPHSWSGGGAAGHGAIDITEFVSIKKGEAHHLRIEVNGNKASTYIDGILVDADRENPRGGDYGYGAAGIGFRADYETVEGTQVGEKAYYDNIVVKAEVDGEEKDMITADFSDPEVIPFTYGTIEEGRLYVERVGSSTSWSWYQELSTSDLHFTVEADMNLISNNAAIIFSAKSTSSFYMWSVNTTNADQPLLRRHYNDGSWHYTDALIGNFPKSYLVNQVRRLKIDVKANVIRTYIDDVLVDAYTDTYNQLTPTGVGFRANRDVSADEIAEWDNVIVTDYTTGDSVVIFSEDFESGVNPFDKGEIRDVDGNAVLRIFNPTDGDLRTFDDSMYGIPLFRTEFGLDKEVQSARIYTSGFGVYDVFINGQRVGTPVGDGVVYDELKPGWTDYKKTVFYSTYDVTGLLQQGDNAIGASVASGWWNGEIARGEYGNLPSRFLAKLVVEYAGGSSTTVVTNPETWRSSTSGPVRTGDIYNGESYDARKESNWSSPEFDDSDWFQCANVGYSGAVKAFIGTPVQVRPELQRTPVKITKYEDTTATGTTYGVVKVVETYNAPSAIQLSKGQTAVYDLGQNMAGWVKFNVKGAAGSKLTIRFAEMLNDNGDESRGNDGPGGSLYRAALRSAQATLTYTLKGDADGEEFHPSTSFFGFRYCDVTTTHPVEIASLTGEVVGTAAEESSSLVTSHPDVNQLYSNILWGQRSNFLSVPTDCPQRDERLGWTGDIQVFGRAATYNADLAGFFHKWMGDMRDDQNSNGAYPHVAPYAWNVGYGAAAWADAGITTPWTTYLMYSDIGILEENFESMERYMEFLANQAGDGYQYNGGGTSYGDWVAYATTDSRYISVCYYAYSALLMEKVATALSHGEDNEYAQRAESYRTLYENIKAEFQTRYISGDSKELQFNTQTAYLLALKLDLFPDDASTENAIAHLNQLFIDNGNKLNTGFLGTGILNQTLSETGLTDMAYNLLLQRNDPSWLYSIDQGATTIWERWNSYTKEKGFGDIGMNSFNHYAYGAVGEWMFRYMAGINPDESNPGFKHIILNPSPDFRETIPEGQVRITKAAASYSSYYGAVRSAWEIERDNLVKYDVTIPANTTATLSLTLNSDREKILKENGLPAEEAEGVISVTVENGKAVIELQSGSYSFEVQDATYIVTFETDGGSSVEPQEVTYGETATKPADPAKSGYVFAGWHKDAEFVGAWNFEADAVSSDTTLYAKWIDENAVIYTVTFSSNGSTVGSLPVEENHTVAQLTPPSNVGYTFGGWYSDEDFATVWSFANDVVTANITLYAKWTIITYNVTFASNEGSSVDPQQVAHGSKIDEPANPTREGYTFGGWYKDDETFAVAWSFEADVLTAPATLYAKWTINTYAVTFAGDGVSVDPQQVDHGDKIDKPADPTRTGYTFGGWYKDAGFAAAWDFDNDVVAAAVTLYAKWNETSVTGIESEALDVARVYPNPTTGIVTIENNGEEVLLYSLSGTLLRRTDSSSIDLSGYPNGTYLLKTGRKTAVVVKQ